MYIISFGIDTVVELLYQMAILQWLSSITLLMHIPTKVPFSHHPLHYVLSSVLLLTVLTGMS
jgi:hypothetical protein